VDVCAEVREAGCSCNMSVSCKQTTSCKRVDMQLACICNGSDSGSAISRHAAAVLVVALVTPRNSGPPLLLSCRAQAAVGNLLASLIPRQQMVPAVKPENLHPDPDVVRQQRLC
jgi:hypothetical protein